MKRLALALLLVACRDLAAPDAGAVVIPPAAYATWWEEIEACSGRSGRLARITWHAVPADDGPFFRWQGRPRAGLWIAPHAIYLSDSLLLSHDLVKHEMLHDLLQDGHHPSTFQACGVRYPILIPQESR